ncbi:MAG: N-acetylmuramoyl-L-alanine amidase [Firmicutes bacterium]|nr:N-acetylmuramoyl-L-alanine amidase [Bacillota bacterium]MCL2771319.1 N-acetylmuramoyl-L-alanine amidase [Bacillota bacterium]
MITVVLDAGHGGTDSGAVYASRLEKNDNLKLTLKISELLKACGVNVVHTRHTDVFVPLSERSAISNRIGADLFISIHRNSSAHSSSNGLETYVFLAPSQSTLKLAENIHKQLLGTSGMIDNGIKRATFSVLKSTSAPSILLEVGYLSNAEDNRLFDQNLDSNAQSIANAIMEHFNISCKPVIEVTPQIDARKEQVQAMLEKVFGTKTKEAIMRFQKNNRLAQDGYLNQETIDAFLRNQR